MDDANEEELTAACFTELVDRCLRDFDQDGSRKKGTPGFALEFFLAYQWYTEPTALLEIFKGIYDKVERYDCAKPEDFNKEQVCQAVHFWINQCGDDFKATTMVFANLEKFESKVTEALGEDIGKLLRTDKWVFSRSSKRLKPHSVWRRQPSLCFSNFKPSEIAQQITYLDWKGCVKIPFAEWKLYVKTTKTEGCLQLKKQITLFNNISKWITAMILSKQQPEERAELMKTFVLVAKDLLSLCNFNSLLAVMGGLTHTSVSRLQRTKTFLSHEHKLFLTEMTDFLSPKNNYGLYREKIEQNAANAIPILGIVMKDLVAIDVAHSDFVENNKINCFKLTKLADTLMGPYNLCKATLDITAKKELLHLLRVSLQCRLTEDELYNLSLEREPRIANCKTPQPTEAAVFAEWASGSDLTPDRKTVEKHVDAMVQAVFKIYDADRNGTISKDEFENISTNFPYMEKFAVLDANCDGSISKYEMKNYFMNLNSHDMTKDFLHNFQETTFFAPTYCEYCMGFLWGIGRAGFKCKDCGITCHKDCRNHVVLECRPRSCSVSAKEKTSRAKMLRRRLKYFEQELGESNTETSRDSPDPPSPNQAPKNAANSSAVNSDNGLIERLRKAEEERDHLHVQNDRLQYDLKKLKKQMIGLEDQMTESRQRTVQYLIEQMSRLQHPIQTDV